MGSAAIHLQYSATDYALPTIDRDEVFMFAGRNYIALTINAGPLQGPRALDNVPERYRLHFAAVAVQDAFVGIHVMDLPTLRLQASVPSPASTPAEMMTDRMLLDMAMSHFTCPFALEHHVLAQERPLSGRSECQSLRERDGAWVGNPSCTHGRFMLNLELCDCL
jgi:hypothetical protein